MSSETRIFGHILALLLCILVQTPEWVIVMYVTAKIHWPPAEIFAYVFLSLRVSVVSRHDQMPEIVAKDRKSYQMCPKSLFLYRLKKFKFGINRSPAVNLSHILTYDLDVY